MGLQRVCLVRRVRGAGEGNMYQAAGSLIRSLSWLTLTAGALWLPVRIVLAVGGMSLALSMRETLRGRREREHDTALLLRALVASRPPADPPGDPPAALRVVR